MTLCECRYLRCHETATSQPGFTLSIKRLLTRTCCRMCGRHRGNYLILTYLSIKCLYLINVVAQLFLLDLFLGVPFHSYGVDVIRGIVEVMHHLTIAASRPVGGLGGNCPPPITFELSKNCRKIFSLLENFSAKDAKFGSKTSLSHFKELEGEN